MHRREALIARKQAELDTETAFGTRKARFYERLVWSLSDWRLLPQSWRRILRKKFARKIVGPFDVEKDNLKFRLYPAENYCDRVLFGRGELPEQAEHMALLPHIEKGMVFVDIGGNVGTYSAFVGHHTKGDLTLIAFEPHPRTYRKLVFNLTANGLSCEHVINCGIGAEAGELDLWSDGGSNIGHTSMLKAGTSNPKHSVRVPVHPLLDMLQQKKTSRVDLLKIDIEGFEDRALAPFFDRADRTLWPKTILLETAHAHLWERDLLALMSEAGYSTVFSTKENRLISLQA